MTKSSDWKSGIVKGQPSRPYKSTGKHLLFTALHGMQTRSYDEISVVRQSVCPSVCQTRALWQNGRKICLHFYNIRKIIYPSFLRKRNGWWGRPLYWNFGSTGPRWSEMVHFEPIIARSASAVRPSEKCSINTNRKSSTRFPTSLRWSSYVVPQRGA